MARSYQRGARLQSLTLPPCFISSTTICLALPPYLISSTTICLTLPPFFIPSTALDRAGGGCGPLMPEKSPPAESLIFFAATPLTSLPAVNSYGCRHTHHDGLRESCYNIYIYMTVPLVLVASRVQMHTASNDKSAARLYVHSSDSHTFMQAEHCLNCVSDISRASSAGGMHWRRVVWLRTLAVSIV